MGKSFMLQRVSACRGPRWERVRVNTHFFQFTKLQALLAPVTQEKNPKYDAVIAIAHREK